MLIFNRTENIFFVAAPLLAASFLAAPAFAQSGTWESKTPMPTGVEAGVAGVVAGKLYVIGNNGDYTATVNEVYDPKAKTNNWETRTPSSVLRPYAASGVIGTKIYVVGGCINADCRIGTTNLLEAYDANTDAWSTLPDMPTARGGLTAGVINGKLYVVGGEAACPPCVPQYGTLEVFDPKTNSWTTKAPMPTPRTFATASVMDGKLYVAGGYVRSLDAVTNKLEVYDPVTNQWTSAASMPTARQGAASGVLNGQMHVVGGNGAAGILATHEVYDPATNNWITEVSMPSARWRLETGVFGTTLYALGGVLTSYAMDTNEAFTSRPQKKK